MSLSKIVTPVSETHGITQVLCREVTRRFVDAAVKKMAIEKSLTLSCLGQFTMSDHPDKSNKGIRVVFRPAPKLVTMIERSPQGKTPDIKKEISGQLGLTQTKVRYVLDSIQREICEALVEKGEFTIQELGTFQVANEEASSEKVSSKVQFRPRPFLRNLLSKLSGKQIARIVADRAKKQDGRKKAAVSSGTLDRKRLARVRKLLHARDPENVAMAMLVLEQVALPEDYVAIFETSGLIERLLRADSAEVVDAAAKIVAATKNTSVQNRFWKMIGLKASGGKSAKLDIGAYGSSVKDQTWVSTKTLEEFFRDTRNQSLKSVSICSCSNLSDLRLAGLSQLSKVDLSSSGIRSLHLENLPTLKSASISSCEKLCELSLSGLENLRELRLGSCSIGTLPEEIGELCSLHELDLRGNPLKALPESIGQLSQLETLNLRETSLAELPESIGGLVNLKSLDLSESGLVELPASIGGLAALTELDLSSTGIESLPGTIGQLKSLQRLVLPSKIEDVPRELGRLSCLRKLYFGSSWNSDESTTTRIILDLCRQLVAASGR